MATKTLKATAPAPLAAPTPLPRAYWVIDPTAAGANGLTGFVEMSVADGDAAVAAGKAQDPFKEDGLSLKFIQGDEPGGWPWVDPTPEPVVLNITAFTAASPTACSVSAGDAAKVSNGASVLLAAVAGDPGAMDLIDGQTATVAGKTSTTFTLAIDLSGADVTGLAATATVQA